MSMSVKDVEYTQYHSGGNIDTWIAAPPKPAVNGQDPSGHDRNQQNWDHLGGHYGHCPVPNNVHWDPAYTGAEVSAVMEQVASPNIAHPGGGAQVMDDHGSSGHHSS
jgi:hypothetical protein